VRCLHMAQTCLILQINDNGLEGFHLSGKMTRC
jgi:hypothetical protein